MTKEEILEECQGFIDEICEKFHYDREDTEGNDSLRTVLLKAIPCMLVESSKEDRELFYRMLNHTPIVLIEAGLTREGLEELKEKYIGDVNPHIIEGEKADLGEYGKIVGDSCYIGEPVIDENMKIIGKKSFIYVQKVQGKQKEFFGTDINVSHLMHETGHAWHAEDDQFKMLEDGTLIERVGTAECKYSFEPAKDGKFIQKKEQVTGLMIEED